MFRASDIIDLPIVSLRTGKRICTVKSLIIDTKTSSVFGFLCKESLVKRFIDIIPYKSLIRLDYNALTVYDRSVFRRISINTILHDMINFENIIDKFIINKDGELIGRITDVHFEALSGKLEAYEISEGYLDDFFNGRKVIRCYEKDNLFINQVNNIQK